jgi:hypothetical protein
MLASSADRDRAIEVLKASFAEGRLTREELDLRVGQALVSRWFPELMAIISDLPAGTFGRLPAHPATHAFPRTSRLAVLALARAAAAPVTAGVTAIPAIGLGHLARRQVRRTGQQGARLAAAAVLLGWLVLLITMAWVVRAA